MEYEVIHFFTDLQDSGHPYKPGDKFPRDGINVNESRIRELSGTGNRQKKPLIRKIESAQEETLEKENDGGNSKYQRDNQEPRKYTKTDINKMSTVQLQSLAAESGIEDAEQKNGGELKKLLIEKFSL